MIDASLPIRRSGSACGDAIHSYAPRCSVRAMTGPAQPSDQSRWQPQSRRLRGCWIL